ncbi:MAG: hypothetical protein KJ851_00550, partial [Nanoarchaeota archaeon]|nr:hypothetical protein [Nanoarchaeota archaeon]
AVEQPKEPVKEETNAEQPKEPDAPAVEEHKAAPYFAYVIAAIVLIIAAAYVIKEYLNEKEAPQNEPVPEPKAKYSAPARGATPKKQAVSRDARNIKLQKPVSKNDDLGDIEKRLDEIKKKLKE